MFNLFKRLFVESLTDSRTGKFSHSKVIAMIVCVGATAFIWKIIVAGGMSIEYFIAYLAYGTGHQTLNKYLDGRSNTKHNQQTLPQEEEDDPKPPRPQAGRGKRNQ